MRLRSCPFRLGLSLGVGVGSLGRCRGLGLLGMGLLGEIRTTFGRDCMCLRMSRGRRVRLGMLGRLCLNLFCTCQKGTGCMCFGLKFGPLGRVCIGCWRML